VGVWNPGLLAEVWAFLERVQSSRRNCSRTSSSNCAAQAASEAAAFGRSLVDGGDGALNAPGRGSGSASPAQALTLFVLQRLSAGHVAAALRPFASVGAGGASLAAGAALWPCGGAVAWRAPVRQRLVFAFTRLEDALGLSRLAASAGGGSCGAGGSGRSGDAATGHRSAGSAGSADARHVLSPGAARDLETLLAVAKACRLDAWSVAAATLLRRKSAIQRALSSPWDSSSSRSSSCHGVTAADLEAVVEVLAAELTGALWADTLRWAAGTARELWEAGVGD
jgi:hypothetical protein